jgi:3-phosphoshikimate 1-carboxyvinyltransferase
LRNPGYCMALEAAPAAAPLEGTLTPPGDKSISHRALILASLARGTSRISGLLDAADTRSTMHALEQMGAAFSRINDELQVEGLGAEGLSAPVSSLDMGNSGTAMRLLAGVLAAQAFDSVLVGDDSLSQRPMRRIISPLRKMGARIESTPEGTAPLTIRGTRLSGIDYVSPVASAQVKSCILLAGLYASGATSVREPGLSRDHTERMLPLFGVQLPEPCKIIGGARLSAAEVEIPADPSSAAFTVAAALLVPGSDVLLRNVGMSGSRNGFYRAVRAMGADLEIDPCRDMAGDPAGHIRVKHGNTLNAIELPSQWVPSMIDEIPALMVLAARARGITRIRGAGELRVKESDRLAVMSEGLRSLGIDLTEYPDGVDIIGCDKLASGKVEAEGDHRCAMSFAVLGLVTPRGVTIHGAKQIDTSYPEFVADLNALGANLSMGPADGR